MSFFFLATLLPLVVPLHRSTACNAARKKEIGVMSIVSLLNIGLSVKDASSHHHHSSVASSVRLSQRP